MDTKKLGLKTDKPTHEFSLDESVPVRQQLGGAQSLPLPLGKPVAINAAHLTQKEKQDLEAIGWEPGMVIPDNLADWIDKAKRESLDPKFMPLPADPATPPLKVPEMIDLRDLPEAKRKELTEVLKTAQMTQATKKFEQARTPQQPGKGVMDAINTAKGGGRELQLDDDVTGKKEIPDLSRPKRRQIEKPEAKQNKQPDDKRTEEPNPSPETVSREQHICPNCAWNLDRTTPIHVEDYDKNNFLAAILGNIPFQKMYEVFNGQLQITLRTLRPYETDACYRYCYDSARKNQASQAQVMTDLWKCRLGLQLVELRSNNNLVQFPGELKEWGKSGDHTILPEVLESVYSEALGTESLLRIVGREYDNFQQLVTRLEANIENADFWQAVGHGS